MRQIVSGPLAAMTVIVAAASGLAVVAAAHRDLGSGLITGSGTRRAGFGCCDRCRASLSGGCCRRLLAGQPACARTSWHGCRNWKWQNRALEMENAFLKKSGAYFGRRWYACVNCAPAVMRSGSRQRSPCAIATTRKGGLQARSARAQRAIEAAVGGWFPSTPGGSLAGLTTDDDEVRIQDQRPSARSARCTALWASWILFW
jgi:hypothetical protein